MYDTSWYLSRAGTNIKLGNIDNIVPTGNNTPGEKYNNR